MATPLDALRGESRPMVAIRTEVERLLARQTRARRQPPVLILGETGTGKGLLARSIHQAGPRRDGPFVGVNCAAIPETLLEAELFGYERGAFTDARHAKPGLFQTAHGGTLFLDEIGLLPSALQAKLLTVLEDRAVRRLGSTRAEPVDLALIAATSVELKRAVSDGRFREDLYHRLAVISLEMPPLRDRDADILALADHFLVRACADYGLSPRALSPEARGILVGYRWPGNVRELSNAMERVALLSNTDTITAASLDFLKDDGARIGDASTVAAAGSLDDTLRARIETALRENGGNIRRTAASLGVSRNTLRARMDKYGLRKQESIGSRAARGTPASPAKADHGAPTHWERRHLALLRARLLPSSSAIEGARALEMVGEKVRAFGGRIEESSPTGAIAVFGLEPVDNAASHAALAALAIRHATARARTVDSGGADVVIAIHCADHLVSRHNSPPVIGIDGKVTAWAILETLVAADVPGAIFISDPVVPFLVRRFALGRVHEDPRNAWLVLRREEVSAGWTATRFVGRASELSSLRQAAALAEQRHGQIVGIVGEAGVGKSRLVHEAVRDMQGWLLLSSGGAPYMKKTAYSPLVELLKKLCHIQDVDAAPEVRERVARVLRADADPHSTLPPILDLLGVLPLDDAFRNTDPVHRRKRTHDAVREAFLTASLAQPLCLIIEDLHWIDSETQEVLDRLVNSLTGARVLLLVNYRPEYQHSWGSKTCYSQVRVDALPGESADELLEALLGPDAALGPLKRLLVERTEANPLFLEESVRALVETAALAGERGAYRLTRPIEHVKIPATVQAILAARIDRLGPETKRLLQAAAVIGKDVPVPLLLAITDAPKPEVRAELTHLQAAEFLYETRLFPDLEYTFKHALTHEVAYQGLLHDSQRTLHARIAEAIEELYRDRLNDHVERLAYHAVRGERWERAVRYARQAGAKALERSANREAWASFEDALDALSRLPETPATLAEGIDIRLLLRSTLVRLGELERASRHLAEAERLATTLGDRGRLAWLWVYLTTTLLFEGETLRAISVGEKALALAGEVGDAGACAAARPALGHACRERGDLRRAVTMFGEAIDLLPGPLVHERFGRLSLPQGIYSRGMAAICLAELGDFAGAERLGTEAAALTRADMPFAFAMAHTALANVYVVQERVDDAMRALQPAVGVVTAREIPLPWRFALHGYVLALAGRPDEGCAVLARALERAGAIRYFIGHAEWVGYLAHAHLLGGRIDEARRVGDEALRLSRLRGQRGYEAWALYVLGEVEARRGGEAAKALSRQGLALAEALGMRPLVERCQATLARHGL